MSTTTRKDPTTVAEDAITTLAGSTTTLPVDKIRRDGGTQIRLQLDAAKVTEYAELIAAGIINHHGIVLYDGSEYWLADGFHRVGALGELNRTHAYLEVRAGTRRDAVLFAATQANNTHGLPLTREDKRNAALTLLRDDEWSQWTDREIARRVGMTHPTVAKLRVQIEAEHRQAEGGNSDTPSTVRRYTRNGKVLEMDTSKIGSAQETHRLVSSWLDQRSSDDHNRRHIINQLIDNSGTGAFLWRALLAFLPHADSKDDVLPHLRAELARLEETAVVDGETYQQANVDDAPTAPPEAAVQPGEDKTKIVKHCYRCNAPAPWSPEDGLHICSKCGHGIGSNYWPEDEKPEPTPLTVKEAAAVIAKHLNRKAKDPARQLTALNQSSLDDYTPGLLPSRTLEEDTFAAAKILITNQLNGKVDAQKPKPSSTTYTGSNHARSSANWSFEGNDAGEADAAAAAEAWATVSAFAGHVAVNHAEEIATEAWNTPAAALAAAQKGEAKPKHYKALQRLQTEKEKAQEEIDPHDEENWRINQKRSDAAALRQAVEQCRIHIDSQPCRVAGQSLGPTFKQLQTDIALKLRSLQHLLNDQYPEDTP